MPTSGWYNNLEGTVVVTGRLDKSQPGTSNAGTVIYFDNGSSNDSASLRHVIDRIDMYVVTGGTTVVDTIGFLVVKDRKFVAVFAVANNSFTGIGDNGTFDFDVSGGLSSMTTMYIGSQRNQVQYLNGTIAKVAYYPKRLDNQTLRQLSS
jgi:hypothetical protein